MRGAETSYRGSSYSERMAAAPCREEDPELSYPSTDGKRGKGYGVREAEAKKFCARCPVAIKRECLEVAMKAEGTASASMRHGVFGGLDGDERAALARERREAAMA